MLLEKLSACLHVCGGGGGGESRLLVPMIGGGGGLLVPANVVLDDVLVPVFVILAATVDDDVLVPVFVMLVETVTDVVLVSVFVLLVELVTDDVLVLVVLVALVEVDVLVMLVVPPKMKALPAKAPLVQPTRTSGAPTWCTSSSCTPMQLPSLLSMCIPSAPSGLTTCKASSHLRSRISSPTLSTCA